MTNTMVEQDLFNYLKENLYPDLVMSLSPISRWDCYSKKRQHRIELKCRKNHYEELLKQSDDQVDNYIFNEIF